MKFIPLQTFEYINSLLQQVDAQGCLATIRLEAFTCRMNRGERDIAVAVNGKRSAQVSPLIAPQVPLPLSPNGVEEYQLPAAAGHYAPCSTSNPEPVDDRFIYLISALNAIHGEADYDFSVLEQQDFVLLDGPVVVEEVNRVLAALPDTCAPAIGPSGEFFWSTIAAEVSPSAGGQTGPHSWMSECDFFQFTNRECDPLYERSIWSSHYFIYSKRQRIIVSLMLFGEGNMYRGDDGYIPSRASAGDPAASRCRTGATSSRRAGAGADDEGEYYHDEEGRTTIFYADERSNATQPTTDDERRPVGEFDDDDPADDDYGHEQKNRDFYGF